jgi:hypothetical protein
MRKYLQVSVFHHKRASLQALQDRIRNPSLTVRPLLHLFQLFILLAPPGPHEVAQMFYFTLGNLTTNSFGDIAPLNLFARNLAYLETILGQFCIAITIARLVTLELEDRRRSER